MARRGAGPDDRHQRRADPGADAPASAAPTCTSTSGTPGRRRPSRCRWSSATSSSARSSRSARTSTTSTPARSSAARGTSSAAAAATAWPAGGICARTPRASASIGPGRSPSISSLPMTNVWRPRPEHRPRRAVDLRSVRQRRAHGPVVRRAGRGRADHRRRADRHHGRRRRPPCRGPPRRHHRRQPVPPRAGPQDGRDAGRRRPHADRWPTRRSSSA